MTKNKQEKKHPSITRQMTAAIAPLVIIFVAGLSIIAFEFNQSIEKIRAAQIQNLMNYITTSVEVPLLIGDYDRVQDEINRASNQTGILKIVVTPTDGEKIEATNQNTKDVKISERSAMTHKLSVFGNFTESKKESVSKSTKIAVVEILEDTSGYLIEVIKITLIVVLSLALGLAMLFYLIKKFNSKIKHPVEKITDALKRIAKGDIYFDYTPTTQNELSAIEDMVSNLISALKNNTKMQMEVQKMEQETLVAKEQKRVRTEFLAHMSHEIRNPLNVICGYIAMMSEAEADDMKSENKKKLRVIEKAASHLQSMVSDMLDFSSLEAGGRLVKIENTNLWGLVESAASIYSEHAKQKGLYTDIIIDVGVSRDYKTPSVSVKKIIANLVSNATKFTFEGGITVHIKESVPGFMEICVEDTGIGISEEWKSRIFEPFVQVDQGTSKTHEGSGLGLSIARMEAILIGGDIDWMPNPAGLGSIFKFRFPAVKLIEDKTHIDFVSDESIDIYSCRKNKGRSIEGAFRRAGFVGANFKEGVEYKEQSTGHYETSALCVISSGNQQDQPKKRLIHISEQTGKPFAQKETESTLNLNYPLSSEDIKASVIPFFFGKNKQRRNLEGREDVARLRILIVDDDPLSLEIIEWNLTKINVRNITKASAGSCAIQRVIIDEPYDLIITDLHMPKMDGFELIERIRREDPLAKIAVMTADNQKINIEALKDKYGVTDVLGKPFHIFDLRNIVYRTIPSHEDGASVVPEHISQQYTTDMADKLKQLRSFIKVRDKESLCSITHTMIGGAGLFGDHEFAKKIQGIYDLALKEDWVTAEKIAGNLPSAP